MAWTPERIEQLKKLWSEGKSANEIANELGAISRNAVIGKVYRLGLSTRVVRTNPHYRKFYGGGDVPISKFVYVPSYKRHLSPQNKKIYLPPCWRLRAFAEFLFTKKANSNVFGPLFDDVQFEYVEAIKEQRIRLARWIAIRGYLIFMSAVVTWLPVALFDRIKRLSKMIGGA